MPGAPKSRLLLFPLALDYPQDVVCVEDHVVLAVEADLGPRVLGEDDDVALGDLDPVLELADCDDLGGLRLLLGRVGQHYPRSRSLLALDDLDERPLSQRLELHPFDLLVSSDSCTAPRAMTGLARLRGAYAPEIVTGSVAPRQGTYRLLGNLPLFETGDGRNARDAVIHRCLRVVVHVDLDERNVLARLGHLFEDRGYPPARHAPRRPEIDYNRPLRPQNVALESRVRYFGYCHDLEPPLSMEVNFAEHSSTSARASRTPEIYLGPALLEAH